MSTSWDAVRRLLDAPVRTVAGLMSGTSLDGVDAVVARLAGSGPGTTMTVLGHAYVPYAPALADRLRATSEAATSNVRDLTLAGVRLAHLYADGVEAACAAAGLARDALDAVGMHGQTVQHLPVPTPWADAPGVTGTLQLGDAAVLATRLGVPVVADFRRADLALGGQGAPLVPYFDYVRFAHPTETRLLLNLGGIANVTVLPAGGGPDTVYAFDTGPANLVIDGLMAACFGQPFDRDGQTAALGRVDEALLADLLAHPYFALPPPKSTGREDFGPAYGAALLARTALPPADLVATATALTARSIADSYRRFIAPTHPAEVLIAAGGGTHNPTLLAALADALAPVAVRPSEDYGLASQHKEALCFALLAHEFLNGVPTNLPRVTGAARPTLLGTLTLP